jgi:hypothetical protein
MAMREKVKDYKLTEEEAGTPWRYFYKQKFKIGLKSDPLIITKCYVMHAENGDKIEIDCEEMNKLKPVLDLRELGETDKSASAI